MPENQVVTIDGPSSSGKSTAARALAQRMGWTYLDTGAMYRAAAVVVDRAGVDAEDAAGVEALVRDLELRVETTNSRTHVFVDRLDVTRDIRAHRISRLASSISAQPAVRTRMVDLQRQIGAAGRLVADGRDMGSVVFPGAGLKVFLTASIQARARRRYEELVELGQDVTLDQVAEDIRVRDEADSRRELSPLIQPPGAFLIDSSRLTVQEMVDALFDLARDEFDDF